jgi:hypothetical protein
MLIQAFSSNNFERIFDIENRKSKVKTTYLSEEYNNILSLIKDLRTEIKQILRKRKCDRTTKESEQLQIFNEQIHKLLQDKKETRYKDLEFISKQVNKNDFQFNLTIQDENVFIIGDNKESFFAIKQLQYNIQKTFNVKQSSRHTILSQIKLLLNEGFPKYVIRTDVINFFESIPQEKLLKKIENNTLLNIQSKILSSKF